MAEELVQVFLKTTSPNQNELKQANQYLENLKQQSFSNFLFLCIQILSNESHPGIARYQSCLQAKNLITSKNETTRNEINKCWNEQFPTDTKTNIKSMVLKALGTVKVNNVYQRPSGTAQLVAGLAGLEFPNNSWPDLMEYLQKNITETTASDECREASLEAMGYICQDIDVQLVTPYTSEVLTAIVHAMKYGNNNYIKHAATNAMLNSLEFFKENFEKTNERDYIMQVVCECTQNKENRVKISALQCLVKIVSLYYDHMENYMGRALFGITVAAMKEGQDSGDSDSADGVRLQGIEFWSNVCDEEYELAYQAQEAWEKGTPPDRHSKHYAKGALTHLIPILSKILTQQEEHDDDDWSPYKASGVCLGLLAQVTEDDILPLILPFIEMNIAQEDWRLRDAAVVSLANILDGPTAERLEELLRPAMDTLINLFDDSSVAVRDSVAFCISKICEFTPKLVLSDNVFNPLLQKLINGLTAPPRVAENVCWAINALVEAIYDNTDFDEETESVKTYQLSPYFVDIVKSLLTTTERADGNEHNLRSAAYEAIMVMIKCSPDDCYDCVIKTTETIMQRIDQLININESNMSSSERSQVADMQSLLCATLQSVLRKIKPEHIVSISDQVMQALLTLLQTSQNAAAKVSSDDDDVQYGGVHEDALIAVGALAEVSKDRFDHYMQAFLPFLTKALTNYQEAEVCKAAVGVIGDISRALGNNFNKYCENLMQLLLESLNSRELDQSVRPQILNLFGDIAIAISQEFTRYLDAVMTSLRERVEQQLKF